MAYVRWALIALSLTVATFSWWSYAMADSASATAPRYYCPMHPQITSHDPGECPICHMTLEPIPESRKKPAPSAAPTPPPAPKPKTEPSPAASAEPAPAAEPAGPQKYTCPMHPEIIRDEPGRCPICGMHLVPKKEAPKAAPSAAPPGTVPITLTLDRVQAIGVRTAQATSIATPATLRATAVLEAPEGSAARVHVRAAGFIERIAVRETGAKVRAGQELFAIYSPEIYQAQSELLAVGGWPSSDSKAAAGTPLDRSERKLELLGVSKSTIERIKKDGKPARTVSVSTPISGYVTKKEAVLGSYATPEMALYEIVNLSKVYVIASVFPRDLHKLMVGSPGTFVSSSRAGLRIPLKVDLIYPDVSSELRAARVRATIDNDQHGLLPGEYGTVELESGSRSAVGVPRDAVIDTGLHQYVFIDEGEGRFSPRSVVVGDEIEPNAVTIESGVSAGERVVSGATFLLDSESRLQASLTPAHSH